MNCESSAQTLLLTWQKSVAEEGEGRAVVHMMKVEYSVDIRNYEANFFVDALLLAPATSRKSFDWMWRRSNIRFILLRIDEPLKRI